MSDVDFSQALHEESQRTVGPNCTIRMMLDRLDDKTVKAVESAMGDVTVTSAAITRALQRIGENVRANTIRRHRAGECACRK